MKNLLDYAVSLAPAAFLVRFYDTFLDEALDFAEGGIVASAENGRGVFRREFAGEFACACGFQKLLLAFVKRYARNLVHETDMPDFGLDGFFAVHDCSVNLFDKPENPFREVAVTALGLVQRAEVFVATLEDGLVQRVLQLAGIFGSAELQGSHGAG